MANNSKSLRIRLIESAADLFIKNGYYNTTLKMIADGAHTNTGSLAWEFKTKEEILYELVGFVIENQFRVTEEIATVYTKDKILIYAFEACLQLHIAELDEHIREMYDVSYTMPRTSQKIFKVMAAKFEELFKEYQPNFTRKDFYEREIAAAGIMRNYLVTPCDMYFEMFRKIEIFLESTLLLFEVPKYKVKEAIEFVNFFNMREIAEDVLNNLNAYFISRLENKNLF